MSTKSLVKEEFTLDEDFQNKALSNALGNEELSPNLPKKKKEIIQQGVAENSLNKNAVTVAVNMLTKYIPTEALTIYVAIISASDALKDVFPKLEIQKIYWAFVVITPIIFLLIYMNQRLAQKMPPLPKRFLLLPLWKMIASTIAFMVWALAVPNNPYITTPSLSAIAGLGAVIISSILTLADGPANYLFDYLSKKIKFL